MNFSTTEPDGRGGATRPDTHRNLFGERDPEPRTGRNGGGGAFRGRDTQTNQRAYLHRAGGLKTAVCARTLKKSEEDNACSIGFQPLVCRRLQSRLDALTFREAFLRQAEHLQCSG